LFHRVTGCTGILLDFEHSDCRGESRGSGGGRTRGIVGRKENGIITAQDNHQQRDGGDRAGKLFVVGIGPGHPLDRTRRAENAIEQSDVIVGYTRYVQSIQDLTARKRCVVSGMRQEKERCREALRLVSEGWTVSLISSGDPGVYGMAGLALD
jgi:hypothetical protein